jgi:hypothetical protein
MVILQLVLMACVPVPIVAMTFVPRAVVPIAIV